MNPRKALWLKMYLMFQGMITAGCLLVALGIVAGVSPVRLDDLLVDYLKSLAFVMSLFGVVWLAVLMLIARDRWRASRRSS